MDSPSRASRQQLVMANLIAQIASLQEGLATLSAEKDFLPDRTESCLMQLIVSRLNEAAATAYCLEGQWRERQAG